jgi:hypothetical protein
LKISNQNLPQTTEFASEKSKARVRYLTLRHQIQNEIQKLSAFEVKMDQKLELTRAQLLPLKQSMCNAQVQFLEAIYDYIRHAETLKANAKRLQMIRIAKEVLINLYYRFSDQGVFIFEAHQSTLEAKIEELEDELEDDDEMDDDDDDEYFLWDDDDDDAEIKSSGKKGEEDGDISPEEARRILEEGFRKFLGGAEPKKPKKKTKAQLEKEKQLEEREKKKEMSMGLLYKSLVHILHPDIEQDPEKKLVKSEIMKRLTRAWKERNLYELLNIEGEVSTEEADARIADLPDDIIDIYCDGLTDTLQQLRVKKHKIIRHPKYIHLLWVFGDYHTAQNAPIKAVEREYRNMLDQMQEDLHILQLKNKSTEQLIKEFAFRVGLF